MSPFSIPENDYKPAYLNLKDSGELNERVKKAYDVLKCCTLCPRECRVDRTKGNSGHCKAGSEAVVSSYGAHFGEESVLVGRYGSGTIFFTFCNLNCIFCQNYDISQLGRGRVISTQQLAAIMLELQNESYCHNINLVSPTHQIPQILDAINIAAETGLRLPIVYNTGGYDSVETLRLLDGVIDIYLPDMKYGNNAAGRQFSSVPDYWDRNRDAIKEMHRQVGDLIIRQFAWHGYGYASIAVRGLLVRHLVMPNDLASTRNIVEFLASEISRDTYINIMAQYRPEYRALEIHDISRRITAEEYASAIRIAKEAGLHRFAEV